MNVHCVPINDEREHSVGSSAIGEQNRDATELRFRGKMKVIPGAIRTVKAVRRNYRFHRSVADRWRHRWRCYFAKHPLPKVERAA